MTEISGCLWENAKGPAYKGFITIDGTRHQIVCWNRTAKKDGKPFLGISLDTPKEAAAPAKASTGRAEMDDEVPF